MHVGSGNNNDTGLALLGFILLAALGFFSLKSPPLESLRPDNSRTQQALPDSDTAITLPSWSDPLHPVFQRGKTATPEPGNKSTPEHNNYNPNICTIDDKKKAGRLILVALPDKNNVDDSELRTRIRYAIHYALAEEHYYNDSEKTNIKALPDKLTSGIALPHGHPLLLWERYRKTPPSTDEPTENNDSSACIVWLGESLFGDPAKAMGNLVGLLNYITTGSNSPHYCASTTALLRLDLQGRADTQSQGGIHSLKLCHQSPVSEGGHDTKWDSITLVGPISSSSLRNLMQSYNASSRQDLAQDLKKLSNEFRILPATATVKTNTLIDNYENTDFKKDFNTFCQLFSDPHISDPPKNNADSKPHGSADGGLCFLRTIVRDDRIIKMLVDELIHRKRVIEPKDESCSDQPKQHILIISQWDSYYGRSLPRKLRTLLSNKKCKKNTLIQYVYSKSIDGYSQLRHSTPRESNTEQDQVALKTADNQAQHVRKPIGENQYDYIRRLATKIEKQHERIRIKNGQGFSAVFILGGDLYDRLLVLRSLRQRINHSVWLTRDLDAVLYFSSEYRWSRTLLVASSFGFSLNPDFESYAPPFRNNYQTGMYFTLRLALGSKKIQEHLKLTGSSVSQTQLDDSLQPLLFEIARGEAVQLGPPPAVVGQRGSHSQRGINDTRPDSSELTKQKGAAVIFFFSLFLLLMAVAYIVIEKPKWVVIILTVFSLGCATLFGLDWRDTGNGAEPFSLHQGISVWPSEFLRWLVVIVSLTMAVYIYRLFDEGQNNEFMLYFDEKGQTISEHQGKKTAWKILCLVVFVTAAGGAMVVTRLASGELQTRLCISLCIFGVIVFVWLVFMKKLFKSSLRYGHLVTLPRQWPQTSNNLRELWEVHRTLSTPLKALPRCLTWILAYLAFGSLLFTYLGQPLPPCRGVVCRVDTVLTSVSVLSVLLVLFIVIDAIRVCIRFIHELCQDNIQIDRDQIKFTELLPLKHHLIRLKVHLIGSKTRDINRVIYFPMTAILLLLLSRSTYFDDWSFPQALVIIIGMNFALLVFSGIVLNYVASNARDSMIDDLRKELLELKSAELKSVHNDPEPNRSEIEELIKQLSALHHGAYKHLWEQAPFRAGLMVLSGFGFAYVEYLPFS